MKEQYVYINGDEIYFQRNHSVTDGYIPVPSHHLPIISLFPSIYRLSLRFLLLLALVDLINSPLPWGGSAIQTVQFKITGMLKHMEKMPVSICKTSMQLDTKHMLMGSHPPTAPATAGSGLRRASERLSP